MRSFSLLLKASSVLLALIVPMQASIIFTQQGGGTGNNVLMHCPSLDAMCEAENADNDTTLIGTVQNTPFQVLFDANVNIQPGAAGQSTITPVTAGADWRVLSIDWANFAGTDEVVLRIKPTTDATITLSAEDQFGNIFNSDFTGVPAPQGWFFKISTLDNQLITTVRVEASQNLAEVEQLRIGEIAPVPEPATTALFGMGLVVLGVMARRRSRRL